MPIYALAPRSVTSSTSSRICLRVDICGLPSRIYSSYTLDSYDSLSVLIPGLACMIRYLEYGSCARKSERARARKFQPLSTYFGCIQCVILFDLALVLLPVYIYSEMIIFRDCKTRATWWRMTFPFDNENDNTSERENALDDACIESTYITPRSATEDSYHREAVVKETKESQLEATRLKA